MGKINRKLLNSKSGRFSVPLSRLQQKFARKRCIHSIASNSSATAFVSPAGKRVTDDNDGKILLEEKAQVQVPRRIITKKAKLRLKHKKLMKKFDVLRSELKSERARRNREKTAIVGDLKPLKDALPSLDELYEYSRNHRAVFNAAQTNANTTISNTNTNANANANANKKLRKREKIRLERKKLIDDINSYQQLLNDANFKRNPRDAIRLHIKHTHSLNFN